MIQPEWRGIVDTAELRYWTHDPDGSLPLAKLDRPFPWAIPRRATSIHTYIHTLVNHLEFYLRPMLALCEAKNIRVTFCPKLSAIFGPNKIQNREKNWMCGLQLSCIEHPGSKQWRQHKMIRFMRLLAAYTIYMNSSIENSVWSAPIAFEKWKEEKKLLFVVLRMTVSYTHLTLPTTPYV